MFTLYSLVSPLDVNLSFIGTTIGLSLTILFLSLSQLNKKSVLFFHWLPLLMIFLFPHLIFIVIAFFCILIREVIIQIKSLSEYNSKLSLFLLLTIIQTKRCENRIFLFSFIILMSAFLYFIIPHFYFLEIDIKYFPLACFSICLSLQLQRDFSQEQCQNVQDAKLEMR